MKYLFERCFKSDLHVAKRVVGEVLRFLHSAVPAMPADTAADLRLIFDELLTNAVAHGNQFDDKKSVSLYVEVDGVSLFSCIADEGRGFDYNSLVHNFLSGGDVLSDHGRGVWLAYYMTDKMSFNDNGNEIKFSKRLVADE